MNAWLGVIGPEPVASVVQPQEVGDEKLVVQ